MFVPQVQNDHDDGGFGAWISDSDSECRQSDWLKNGYVICLKVYMGSSEINPTQTVFIEQNFGGRGNQNKF